MAIGTVGAAAFTLNGSSTFVKESFDRAVRYSVSVNDGELGPIGTEALVQAADGLRNQLALMEAAKDAPKEDTLGSVVADTVKKQVVKVLDNVTIQSSYDGDDEWGSLSVNGRVR